MTNAGPRGRRWLAALLPLALAVGCGASGRVTSRDSARSTGERARAVAPPPPTAATLRAPCEDEWRTFPLRAAPIAEDDAVPFEPEVRRVAASVADEVSRRPPLGVRVHGMACASEGEGAARRRAQRFAGLLVELGVPARLIRVTDGPITCGHPSCSCCCRRRAKCSETCPVWDPPRTRAVQVHFLVHRCEPAPSEGLAPPG